MTESLYIDYFFSEIFADLAGLPFANASAICALLSSVGFASVVISTLSIIV
jgi:hypothetical protein